jgi:hypothetical protein
MLNRLAKDRALQMRRDLGHRCEREIDYAIAGFLAGNLIEPPP